MSRRVGIRHIPSIGGKACKVNIVIQKNGTSDSESIVKINSKSYHDGDATRLSKGTYNLSWQAGNEVFFYKWAVAENISVADLYAGSTSLTVTCGGTLTLSLTCPPAWNYDNLVGDIWLEDTSQYSYDNRGTGEVEVREPSGEDALGEPQGGYYDNRE